MTQHTDLPDFLEALLKGTQEPHDLPWVTISYAQSLDGSIAARRGTPLALSGPATLEITHRLRARHSAILIGIDTLLADDPRLSVRSVSGEDPQPVILDNFLRTPLTARLLQNKKLPWIMTAMQGSSEREMVLVGAGARVFRFDAERVNLAEVLAVLKREGIRSIMVEGGARVITSFFQARLVDLIVLTLAPRFVGGLHPVESLLPEAGFSLDEFGMQRYEDDLLVWGCPHWEVSL